MTTCDADHGGAALNLVLWSWASLLHWIGLVPPLCGAGANPARASARTAFELKTLSATFPDRPVQRFYCAGCKGEAYFMAGSNPAALTKWA